jgi:hypothetical protein
MQVVRRPSSYSINTLSINWVRQSEQPLDGLTIRRVLFFHQFQIANACFGGQSLAERFWKGGHLLDGDCFVFVKPFLNLPGTVGGLAPACQQCRQLLVIQIVEVRPVVPCRADHRADHRCDCSFCVHFLFSKLYGELAGLALNSTRINIILADRSCIDRGINALVKRSILQWRGTTSNAEAEA